MNATSSPTARSRARQTCRVVVATGFAAVVVAAAAAVDLVASSRSAEASPHGIGWQQGRVAVDDDLNRDQRHPTVGAHPDFVWVPIATTDDTSLNDYMDDDVPAGATVGGPPTLTVGSGPAEVGPERDDQVIVLFSHGADGATRLGDHTGINSFSWGSAAARAL